MGRDVIFRLTLGIYYLALGVWCGATAMMGVSAGLTFVTLRAANPVLPGGPAGNQTLAPHTADFLAGNVVNASFQALTTIQLGCIVVLVATVMLQTLLWRDRQVRRGRSWANRLRIMVLLAALGLFAFDLLATRSEMAMLRGEMYEPQVTAESYATMQRDFQVLHERSARTQLVMAGSMAAIALLSPFAFVQRRTAKESADG